MFTLVQFQVRPKVNGLLREICPDVGTISTRDHDVYSADVHSSSYCQGHGDKKTVPASHDLFEWDCTATRFGRSTVAQIRTRRSAPRSSFDY